MTILELFKRFKTNDDAIAYLERIRWAGKPKCPYCQSESIGRHVEMTKTGRRYKCKGCKRSFSVTVGTLFHRTHVPLQKWFLVIALMLNAKKSLSAYQIARDTGIRRTTVWTMQGRIRAAMALSSEQKRLLEGIVEADETMGWGVSPEKALASPENPAEGQPRPRLWALSSEEARLWPAPSAKRSTRPASNALSPALSSAMKLSSSPTSTRATGRWGAR